MTQPLKLLTYNVHRGRSAFRRRDICSEVAAILDFWSADVVCLQEVWQDEGFDRHQLEHLTEERWDHRIFAKNVEFRHGAQGNAVLSSLPVLSWNNFDISIARREPRGILNTVIDLPNGRTMAVLCAHFGLLASERRRQAALLKSFIEVHIDAGTPVVLAGDFNDWRGDLDGYFRSELQMREVMSETLGGRRGRTYPAYMPMLSLDRIYFRNCDLKQARIVRDRRCLRLSDHLPVEAEFLI